jgi:hypothetical protein
MGLNRQFLNDLVTFKRRGFAIRCVAEIGAQQLSDTLLSATDILTELYEQFGRQPVHLGDPVGVQNFSRLAPPSTNF